MAHSIERRYRWQVLVLMAIYMAIMIWLWPHALGASGKTFTDGSILIWVFPALCCTYGVTRMSLKYRYTGSLDWFC